MLGFVDASARWKIHQISDVETTRCHDVRTCVATDAQFVDQNKLLC